MPLEDCFDRLGGIKPISGSAFHPLSEGELQSLEEAWDSSLPDDYRQMLREIGGFAFRRLTAFHSLVRLPHSAADGREPFSHFYGGDFEGFNSLKSQCSLYWSAERIPKGLAPIGSNFFGDQICLGLEPDQFGRIFFWDHDDERDPIDYFENHGSTSAPRDFLFGNTYLVADSLTAFLHQLTLDS